MIEFGGLIGYSNTIQTIEDCYNEQELTTQDGPIGGLIGMVNNSISSIKNCRNVGHIKGKDYVGGLIGRIYNGGTVQAQIQNCYNIGSLIGTNYIGGIIGTSSENYNILDCYNEGKIVKLSNDEGGTTPGYAGGLIGYGNVTTMTNCYNTAEIQGGYAGGLLGYNNQNLFIQNCRNTGNIVSIEEYRTGGLIGYSTSAITIENSENVGQIQGGEVGGLIGSTVELVSAKNCYNKSDIQGKHVGGIVGTIRSGDTQIIENCHNQGNIICNSGNAGGIIGENYAKIKILSACTNERDIKATKCAGGIIGKGYNSITNMLFCYNTAKIEAQEQAGGLLGYTPIENIEKCYNTANITSKGCAGGIIGQTDGNVQINKCYNVSMIQAEQAGGLIGYIARGKLENCYQIGNVSGISVTSSIIGGLVGKTNYADVPEMINCYVITEISNAKVMGMLVGQGATHANIQRCYFNVNKNALGVGTVLENTIIGYKTIEEMKTQEFLNLLNNGTNNWQRKDNENNGLPQILF